MTILATSAKIKTAMPMGGEYQSPFRVILPGGTPVFREVPGRVDCGPLGTPVFLFCALYDVTERKTMLREPHQTVDQLLTSNVISDERLFERTTGLQAAAGGQMTLNCTVSRDLRAPLRQINSVNSMLEEDFGPPLPEEARRYLAPHR